MLVEGFVESAPVYAGISGEHVEASELVMEDMAEVVEEALGLLLQGLQDTDTVVRWSASKGLGRMCARLPKVESSCENAMYRANGSAQEIGSACWSTQEECIAVMRGYINFSLREQSQSRTRDRVLLLVM